MMKRILQISFILLFVGCASSTPVTKMNVYEIMGKYNTSKADAQKIKDGTISVGFTKEIVKATWGNPSYINTNGSREQWRYYNGGANTGYVDAYSVNATTNGRYSDVSYIYFENDKVITIQKIL